MEPTKELEKAIENKFLTPQKFAIEIEKIVVEEELNYIDAIPVSYTHLTLPTKA